MLYNTKECDVACLLTCYLPCYTASFESPVDCDMTCILTCYITCYESCRKRCAKQAFISRPCHLTYPRPQTVWAVTLPCLPNHWCPTKWVPRDPFQSPPECRPCNRGYGLEETAGNKQLPCNLGTYWGPYCWNLPRCRGPWQRTCSLRQHADPQTERREQLTQRKQGTRRSSWTHMALEAFRVQISWREGPETKNSGWALWHSPR